MNKGFTLIELLACIVVIGLIMVISIPSYIYINNSIKNTNYNNKLKIIKEEALNYGEKIKDDIQVESCSTVQISDLIKKGYITSDYRTKDALENPLTNKEFNNDISICYCTSNNELKAFYLDSFNYTKSYAKGSEVTYNGKVYTSMSDYNYSEIVTDINNNKKTDFKWNNSGVVTDTCNGYFNKEIDLCITSVGTINDNYIINNFFRLIEC